MRILQACSEVHPYSKTGGLGDMVGALAKTQARMGHDVSVVTPLYRGIRERFPAIEPFDWKMELPLGSRTISSKVWILRPAPRLTVYFIDQPDFYNRGELYHEHGKDYPDNASRFIFFSKAVVHLARYLPDSPGVVHLHDWQTGLVPLLIRHQQRWEGWGTPPATCLTIHNLMFQGVFAPDQFGFSNLPGSYFANDGVAGHGQLNCLKAGIVHADAITTVSPRYAREVTTEAMGCGLDGVLRARQGEFVGILNGVDLDEWNTTHNRFLKYPYSPDDLSGKAAQKADLQREVGLPVRAEVPLFGSITRIVEQKGVDLMLAALGEMLADDMQFVLLGTGDPKFEAAFVDLARRFPDKASIHIGFDQAFAHRIEAGCDFFLMPSRFEPCGLTQMYSQRYGTIPIVRKTGGLDDTVIDLTESLELPTGIKFERAEPQALAKAIRKALVLFRHPDLLAHYRRNGMQTDFSWARTAIQMTNLYQRALGQLHSK